MKLCKDCSLFKFNNFVCPIFGPEVKGTTEGCPKYKDGPIQVCAVCGRPLIDKSFLNFDLSFENFVEICPDCSAKSGTCALCKATVGCDFQSNPINIPPLVMQTVRQGNAVIQTQVVNPERVKATCENGCPCWDKEEKECWRQHPNQTCGNYESIVWSLNKDITINESEEV